MGEVIDARNRFKPFLQGPCKTVIKHEAYTMLFHDDAIKADYLGCYERLLQEWRVYEVRPPSESTITPARMAELLDKFFNVSKCYEQQPISKDSPTPSAMTKLLDKLFNLTRDDSH